MSIRKKADTLLYTLPKNRKQLVWNRSKICKRKSKKLHLKTQLPRTKNRLQKHIPNPNRNPKTLTPALSKNLQLLILVLISIY